jgi:diacylglycerol O-acyltransferase
MKKFEALDLMFFLLEKPTKPMHMTILEVFDPPRGYRGNFVDRVVSAYRKGRVGEPFNLRPSLLSLRGPHWEQVQSVDLEYHVRRVALPSPGTTSQLMDLAERLNEPLLDRQHPLWQCDVIEGLEGDRFALLIRVHHAYVDGMGGARMMAEALNRSSTDSTIKFPWVARSTPPERRPSARLGLASRLGGLLSGVGEQARALPQLTAHALAAAGDVLGVTHTGRAAPFTAPQTRLTRSIDSAARSFAVCDISLTDTKRVNSATGTSVNDVVLTLVDHAVHRYLAGHGEQLERPLIISMPVATRGDDDHSASNRVGILQVQLGNPDAPILDRLAQVSERAGVTKSDARALSQAALTDYTLMLASLQQVLDEVPGFSRLPSIHNFLVSNVRGIPSQMYLGGAPLRGTYPIPIVPPGSALNITVFTNANALCFGFGGARDVLRDIQRLADFTVEGFDELDTEVAGLPQRRARGGARRRPRPAA